MSAGLDINVENYFKGVTFLVGVLQIFDRVKSVALWSAKKNK
jgi:hypothetical protein